MSIQLKKYMRRFEKNGEHNLVSEWYSMLELHEKAEIEITPLSWFNSFAAEKNLLLPQPYTSLISMWEIFSLRKE